MVYSGFCVVLAFGVFLGALLARMLRDDEGCRPDPELLARLEGYRMDAERASKLADLYRVQLARCREERAKLRALVDDQGKTGLARAGVEHV